MGKRLNYIILPILFTSLLLIASSCNSLNDLAYYYATNTGAGNGNSCCCDGSNSNSSGTATLYCEPEAPILVACPDGTITIGSYKGVSFATAGSCSAGQYVAALDGVMTVGPNGTIINSAGKELLWTAQGTNVVSTITLPGTIESLVVLPDGTVLGYTNSVAATLGKLVMVNTQVIGQCAAVMSPPATLGHSALWCGDRVVVGTTLPCNNSKIPCTLAAAKTLASIKVAIPTGTYLTLTQEDFSTDGAVVYVTGVKDLAIVDSGILTERATGLPVLDIDGLQILVPTAGVTKLSVSDSDFIINGGVWATLKVSAVESSLDLEPLLAGKLPAGFKVAVKSAKQASTVDVASPVNSVALPEQNVCIDNALDLANTVQDPITAKQ